MTATPGRAVYEAQHAAMRRRFPGIAEIRWNELGAEAQAEWEDIARAGIAAYIEANGRDPVDARSVILEAAGLPVVTAGRLATALKGAAVLVTSVRSASGESMWTATPARPHDLAVQLLSAIDPRLTDDAPQPAGRLPCSVCEDEAVTSPHGVPS